MTISQSENVMQQDQVETGAQMTSEQKVVLGSTTLGFTLDHMDATFLSFALAPMIAELHITGAQGGIIAAMSNWGALLGSLLFGILADRIGRVKVLSYTIMLVTFATVILAFLDNTHTIYAARFLLGMGTGGEYGVSMALIAESFRASRVGRMSSNCNWRTSGCHTRGNFSNINYAFLWLAWFVYVRIFDTNRCIHCETTLKRNT